MCGFHRPYAFLQPVNQSQVVGGAISFSVNGRQYIAVSAGGGTLANLQVGMTPEADMTSGSNAIYVFALPQ